jgi:hypothetical protein
MAERRKAIKYDPPVSRWNELHAMTATLGLPSISSLVDQAVDIALAKLRRRAKQARQRRRDDPE